MVILNASDPNTATKMNDIINNAKHVFILVYMVGCGPCNATRPEWKKMCQSLENKYSSNNDVAILDLDSKFMNEVKKIGNVSGFPTMKYMTDKGNKVESYEDSNIPDKQRSSDSFIDWIESKVSKTMGKKNMRNSVNDLSKLISAKQKHSATTITADDGNYKKYKNKNKKNKNNKIPKKSVGKKMLKKKLRKTRKRQTKKNAK